MNEKTHRILDRAARILLLTGALVFMAGLVNFAIYLKAGTEVTVRLICWAFVYAIAGLICTAVESAED